MAVDAVLVCDYCSVVIGAASTATAARRDSSHLYRRVRGKDMCNDCCRKHGYKPRRPIDARDQIDQQGTLRQE